MHVRQIQAAQNAKLLERMPFAAEAFQAIKLTARSFKTFFQISTGIAFLIAVLTGPTLISADLRNNGLPLYFARPLTRWEYVLGKSMVIQATSIFGTKTGDEWNGFSHVQPFDCLT